MGTGFSKLYFNIVSSDFFMCESCLFVLGAIMVSSSVKVKNINVVDNKNIGNLGFLI